MYFKPYYLGCLAHASYLIGGDNGDAAVIDPRRDVEDYLADADAAGLTIRYVIETHLHADFVSGHVELARRAGATIAMGAGAAAAFEHRSMHDGEILSLGDVSLRFLATPGHTPESVTVLAETERRPRLAFTGDTLFIGDVGRPDLVGGKGLPPEQMAGMLYCSLRDRILPLPDDLEIWPAHGAGSACGKRLSEDRVSTLGRQRLENPALRLVINGDEAGFIDYATEGLGTAPQYFAYDARRNSEAPPTVAQILAAAQPLSPNDVEAASEDGILVLDTRASAEYGDGHVPGALHIQLEGNFAPWVGNVVAPDAPLIVVAEPGKEIEAVTRLARVGYENVVGWLDGGMTAWRAAGGEIQSLPQLLPARLREKLGQGDAPHVLDVRTNSEWDAGHIHGAQHIPLQELSRRQAELPTTPLMVICGSGYRSSIACSLLQRSGHRDVTNVVGGWAAWQETAETEKTRVTT